MGYLGIIIFIAAIIWVKKRQFDRRNENAVEVYKSFWHMAGARGADSIIILVGLAAGIAGVISFFGR